jgi:hypothetical protein
VLAVVVPATEIATDDTSPATEVIFNMIAATETETETEIGIGIGIGTEIVTVTETEIAINTPAIATEIGIAIGIGTATGETGIEIGTAIGSVGMDAAMITTIGGEDRTSSASDRRLAAIWRIHGGSPEPAAGLGSIRTMATDTDTAV